jgi:hypothetical protein
MTLVCLPICLFSDFKLSLVCLSISLSAFHLPLHLSLFVFPSVSCLHSHLSLVYLSLSLICLPIFLSPAFSSVSRLSHHLSLVFLSICFSSVFPFVSRLLSHLSLVCLFICPSSFFPSVSRLSPHLSLVFYLHFYAFASVSHPSQHLSLASVSPGLPSVSPSVLVYVVRPQHYLYLSFFFPSPFIFSYQRVRPSTQGGGGGGGVPPTI